MSDQPPEQKNGLLELLKNLWLPIVEFIAAIIAIGSAFYQLWLGQQANITYIFGGGGILLLLSVLAWVGFKTIPTKDPITFEFPAPSSKKRSKHTKKTIAKVEKKKEPVYAYPSQYKGARIALVLVIVGIIVAGTVLLQHRQVLKEKLVVLIATFGGPDEQYGFRKKIIDKLNSDFLDDSKIEIIGIPEKITSDQGSTYARSLGQNYMADVVIWGWYLPIDEPDINIHIENLDPNQIDVLKTSDTLQPTATLAELATVSFKQKAGQETSALISFLAGYLQYKADHYEQARLRFDEAIGKMQGDAILLNNQAEIYFYSANTYYSLGQYSQAINDYSKATEIDPQDAKAYNNRGLSYTHQQKYPQAIKDFSKGIEMDPQDADSFNNRGVVYSLEKKFKQAITDYSKAIKLAPSDASAYYNRGFAYHRLKQSELAITDYSKAIELGLQDSIIYNHRGSVYAEQQQYSKAIADYSKAIEIDPQDAIDYYNRGTAYYNDQQYTQAIADFSKAIQLDRQLAVAYKNRGLAYQALGKTTEAEADFAKYKELMGQEHP